MYMPKVGDVILNNDIPMVVVKIDINEDYASCSYDRTYYLIEETFLHNKDNYITFSKDELFPIKVTGVNFPVIKQITSIAPYEITEVNAYKIRQKTAKTITVYE